MNSQQWWSPLMDMVTHGLAAVRELCSAIRLHQAKLSVAYHMHAVERAKTGLARALHAEDEARAEFYRHTRLEETGLIPSFLLKPEQRNTTERTDKMTKRGGRMTTR